MLKNLLLVALVALSLIACKKDKAGAGGGGGDTAKPSGPLEYPTAKALWDEFTSDKYKGMDAIDHYRPGVKVTGVVMRQMGGEADAQMNYNIHLDVDGQKYIDAQFEADGPNVAAARAKAVKVGDTVTVTCQVGGGMPNYMLLTDCKL